MDELSRGGWMDALSWDGWMDALSKVWVVVLMH